MFQFLSKKNLWIVTGIVESGEGDVFEIPLTGVQAGTYQLLASNGEEVVVERLIRL